MKSEIMLIAMPRQRQDVDVGKHDGIVAVDDCSRELRRPMGSKLLKMVSISSEPVKNALMDAAGEAGNDQQHGVAEHVAVENLPLAQSLRLRGEDVLLADLVEEAVAGEKRHGRRSPERQGDQRQGEVPEVVDDLAEERQLGSSCRRSGRAAETTGRMSRRRTPRAGTPRPGSPEWHSRGRARSMSRCRTSRRRARPCGMPREIEIRIGDEAASRCRARSKRGASP